MARKPLALSNWKMAMTVAESLAFVRDFEAIAGDLLDGVDVVICPPLCPVASRCCAGERGARPDCG